MERSDGSHTLTSLACWLEETGLGPRLSADDRALLARAAHERPFRRGELLWRAGAPASGLLVVLEGRIRVLRVRGSRQHLVHVSGPGATMGEVPLVDGEPYPATAVAASDGRGLWLPAEPMRALLERNAGVAHLMALRLSRRVRTLVRRLDERTAVGVRARIASSLLAAAALEVEGVARIEGTQSEWAEDLGTVREVLARELRHLKRRGWIEKVGRDRYAIRDEDALERLLEAD